MILFHKTPNLFHLQNAKYRENVLAACGQAVGNPTAQAQAALVGGGASAASDPAAAAGAMGGGGGAVSDPRGKIKRLEQLSENLKFDTISQVKIHQTCYGTIEYQIGVNHGLRSHQ